MTSRILAWLFPLLIVISCQFANVSPSLQAQSVAPPQNLSPTTDPELPSPSRLAKVGLRTLRGRHIKIFTDLPPDRHVDALPRAFDQAVSQWGQFFNVPATRYATWKLTGFLIKDRTRFDALRLMPDGNNDQFPHGFALGRKIWWYEQPTPYYRRHLMLHEGTHAFMAEMLGSCGPGWYMEGVAELLATHLWETDSQRLTLRIMPESRLQVPMLGRIKLLQDAVKNQAAPSLPAVLTVDNRRFLGNESYAAVWALSYFLDTHPRYQQTYRSMLDDVGRGDFTERFRAAIGKDWDELRIEWQLFVQSICHNYDLLRTTIDFRAGSPLAGEPRTLIVDSGRGWQSSRIRVEAGKTYRITASGRYLIERDPPASGQQEGAPWWCEPEGVTLRYYQGLPLGVLLAAVDSRNTSDHPDAKVSPTFLRPLDIGTKQEFHANQPGTLYFKVNDSPGELGQNRGKLEVTVQDGAESLAPSQLTPAPRN